MTSSSHFLLFYALKCKELVFQRLATNDPHMLSNYPPNSFNNVLVLMFLLYYQAFYSGSWYDSCIGRCTVSGILAIEFQITKCKFKGLAKNKAFISCFWLFEPLRMKFSITDTLKANLMFSALCRCKKLMLQSISKRTSVRQCFV